MQRPPILLTTLTAAALGGSAAASSSQPPSLPFLPSSCTQGLTLDRALSDEFSDPMTLKQRWHVYDTARDGFRSGELLYRPDMTSMQSGKLLLTVGQGPVPGTRASFPAGAVESTFDVPGAKPGRAMCVEVSTRGFAAFPTPVSPDGVNVFSAAWLATRPSVYERNPNPEVDFQEFFRGDAKTSAMHQWIRKTPNAPTTEHQTWGNCQTGRPQRGDPSGFGFQWCHTAPLGAGDLTKALHTYAVRREIVVNGGQRFGLITSWFDGRLTWAKQLPADSPLVTFPRHVVLSTQGNPPGGPVLSKLPRTAEYDFVRVWH